MGNNKMTRSQLKEAIREIVSKKINEISVSQLDQTDLTKSTVSQQSAAEKNLEAAKKKQEDALRKKRELDKKDADIKRSIYPKTNQIERQRIRIDREVGKATEKVAKAEVDAAEELRRTQIKETILNTIREILSENTLPTGVSPRAIMSLDQFLQDKLAEANGDFLGAQASPVSQADMEDYLSRTKRGAKTKVDKFTMPYVHRGNVQIKNDADQTYDQEKLKAAIETRPKQILKQNKKMEKSGTPNTIFFDIGLPALVGLAVNEKTNEFVIINTCPGAGACKVYCYAKKGGYIQWKDASMSQTRLLNYLVNDPQGFKTQFEEELRSKLPSVEKKGKKILVRWHDAGDFFSPEYLDLAYSIARNFPQVQFYAYTKIANVAKGNKPSNFLINFSMGAKPEEERQIDFGKEKHSTVVPKPMFDKYVMKDEKGKAVRDDNGRVQFKDESALNSFKKDLAMKYNVPVDSVLTYDEMMETPESSETGKYNVIVRPGDGDVSASRKDVKGTYLLIH